jgi:hypothetical protein
MPNEPETHNTDSTWNEKENSTWNEKKEPAATPETKWKKPDATTDTSWDESWAEPKT